MEVELFEKYCLKCWHYWNNNCTFYDESLENIEKDSDGDFALCFTQLEED